ncbi:hypothetical protein LIER_26770 [Lithospermum erythrorhizon]|uniref:Aminotransferase-like plant mobile domain-containing protein n=1 Tax=Lithospermum erythrorhizon TaxID=34254 RepID=A0AAV3RAT3_LITER
MIFAGRVQWRDPLKICRNFDYIPGYWEWDEFTKAFCENWCPSTNTLIIPQGELSIYLWDLLELGGFFVTGRLFDKAVPPTECLSQSLNDEAWILESYRFLLSGYHYLAAQSPNGRVSISAWIGFWNHSLQSYVGYEAADRSTSKVASLNVCPRRSSVVEHRPWYSTDRHPFDILRVDIYLEEETVRFSYLAGCMCLFSLLSFRTLFVPLCSRWPALWLMARRPVGPQMLRYHGKGRGKVYALSEARSVLHSYPVTWKATRPDREQPFLYDDRVSQLPSDRALFVSLHTGRVFHRVGSEFVVEPHNPYRFFRQFGYTPTIPGLSSSTMEMVDLATGLNFRTHVFYPEPNRRVVSPIRRSPEGDIPFVVPDSVIRDQVVEVSFSVSDQEHTELVDTGVSPEYLTTEVAKLCPPSLPTLTIAQQAKTILRTGASSLMSCICNGLKAKSHEMVLKEEEGAMKTFKVLSQVGLGDFAVLHDKLQGFFQKGREIDAPSSVSPPDSTSEALQKLSLLRVTFEDQTSTKQCEV